MRGLSMLLGVAAAFLLGAALALALQPRPVVQAFFAHLTGSSAYDRCVKAGACNAVRTGPRDVPSHLPRMRPQEAPPDLDRA